MLRSGDCQHLLLQCWTHCFQHHLPVGGPDYGFAPDCGVLTVDSVSAFVLIFIEVPWLLRICPTSEKFDNFIRRFTTNWMRAAMYAIMSTVQWLSLLTGASSLIAAAVFLIIAALFYALAGLKSQEFVGSKTLGGQGLAQMIV